MSNQPRSLRRAGGVIVLVSGLFWWTALQAWATARYGYFAVDVIGTTPLLWVLLMTLVGVGLLTGALIRRGANLAAALAVVLAAIVLAIPNIAANLDDGISSAGWLVAGVSIAQVALVIAVLLGPWPPRRVAP